MLKVFCLLAIAVTSVSCRKETCQGNCVDITISGKVVDSSNSRGLVHTPIRVYWQDAGVCYVCPEINVFDTKTDNGGNFSFTTSVDTSRFGGYGLHVSTPVPSGYIPDGYLGDPINQEYVLKESLYRYTPSFNNIRFILYEKTSLNIQLVRTQNDNFTRFDLDYYYDFVHLGLYTYTGAPPIAITSFTKATAANVFTKIIWTKGYGFGQTSSFMDSIKCIANTNNSIIIGY
jgi:hypothetical protein